MTGRPDRLCALRAAVGAPLPSPGAMAAFRDRALRNLVAHAYGRVPYYRRLFDCHGLRPRDIRTVADLPAIPISDKNDLRAVRARDLVAGGLDPERLLRVTTSGVSGEPFTVRRTRLEKRLMAGFWMRAHRHLGARTSDRVAVVRFLRTGVGHDPTPDRRLANAFGRFRHRMVDCTREASDILRVLRDYRPDTLMAYAGVLMRLAEEMTDADRRVLRPRLVMAGGEVLTPAMRRHIRQAFGAPVYGLYGAHELNLIAWDCPPTGEMHTCDDGVILEVIRDGRPAAPGEQGEPVVTNLHSYAMPFIRYRLGDIVTQGLPACACGAPFATIRAVLGRTIDYFPLPDGRRMHPNQITRALYRDAPWLYHYQVVQKRKDLVVLRAVARPAPAPEQLRLLEDRVRSVLGPTVTFHTEIVSALPASSGGKTRALVSEVPRDEA